MSKYQLRLYLNDKEEIKIVKKKLKDTGIEFSEGLLDSGCTYDQIDSGKL